MMRLVILGVLLSIVIFFPRFLAYLSPAGQNTPTPSATITASPSEAGVPAVVTPVDPVNKGGDERLALLEQALEREREERIQAVESLTKVIREFVVRNQKAHLEARSAAKAFSVAAWQMPTCDKLAEGDQPRYFKIGAGILRPVSERDVPDLAVLLTKALLFNLNRTKGASIRFYRETYGKSNLLSDVVSPDERADDAPKDLRVGSAVLNASLQIRYRVDASGELHLKAVLYRLPTGHAIRGFKHSGRDYERVMAAVAQSVSSISLETLKGDASE